MEKKQGLVENCEIDIFFLLHFSKLLQAKTISVSSGSSSYAGLLSFNYQVERNVKGKNFCCIGVQKLCRKNEET